MKTISVIIVTYNSAQYIKDCIISINKIKYPHEIIVIDNHSSDDTINTIRSLKVKVILIEQNINEGYAKANNQAVEQSKGELLFFLNPDTEIIDNSVNLLFEYIQNHQDVGIIAPQLIEPNNIIQASVSHFPSLKGAFAEYFLNKKNAYTQYVPKGEIPIEVEAVYGAAFVISKKLFNLVKGFDERYFLYYEDLDLCRKIHLIGYKVVYSPSVKLKHQVGASAQQLTIKKLPKLYRVLAHFIPMKSTGSQYYAVQSGYIYHGIITGLMIKILLLLSGKLRSYLPIFF